MNAALRDETFRNIHADAFRDKRDRIADRLEEQGMSRDEALQEANLRVAGVVFKGENGETALEMWKASNPTAQDEKEKREVRAHLAFDKHSKKAVIVSESGEIGGFTLGAKGKTHAKLVWHDEMMPSGLAQLGDIHTHPWGYGPNDQAAGSFKVSPDLTRLRSGTPRHQMSAVITVRGFQIGFGGDRWYTNAKWLGTR